ncbi:hypothetical protein L3Y34_011273 [Caenorhabditis briggsae]|uniref:Secreted protein n=1 Tax=Caenorhabditis briggsae TaxID=6238 RepID=A0AAE8ZRD8_CAEBR|nr:hypothetical protein L3Y34_011273 [Caenorhabditis briggsae]
MSKTSWLLLRHILILQTNSFTVSRQLSTLLLSHSDYSHWGYNTLLVHSSKDGSHDDQVDTSSTVFLTDCASGMHYQCNS